MLRTCVAVLIAVLLGAFAAPLQAHASDDACASRSLAHGAASASVRLEDDKGTQTKIVSSLTVHVPTEWRYATGLLLGEDSEQYRRAMRCLMRGPESQFQWWDEWRSHRPEIRSERNGTRVQVDTYAWAGHQGTTWVGPWDIDIGNDYWSIRLNPAPALQHVRWSSVTVEPGSSSAVSAEPRPTRGEGESGLVWEPRPGANMPAVRVRLDPSWQRSWAAQGDRLRFSVPDEISGWTWFVAAMLLYAARRTRAAGPLSPEETDRVTMAELWAWIAVVVMLLTSGDNVFYTVMQRLFGDEWANRQAHYALVDNIVLGWILLLVGRPRRRTLWLAGAALTLPGLTVALRPEALGLTADAFVPRNAHDEAVLGLFTATGCVFALLLMGSAALGWRLAGSAGLIRPVPPATSQVPPRPRELSLRWTAPSVLLTVAVIGLCVANTSERAWQRASWLSERANVHYGIDHLQALRNELAWFAVNSRDWWSGYIWLFSGLAILAVIRARAHSPAASPLNPGPVEKLWMLILFPVMVGLSLGVYVGNDAANSLWFFVNLGSFGLVLTVCRGTAVLERPLRRSGEPLSRTISSQRQQLLDRARRYREIHAKLRRLDQGQSDDGAMDRRTCERELRSLHRWRNSTGAADELPLDVSVVDAALALGPHDTWWENGRRAARLAAFVGLPASALIVWAEQLRGDALTSTLYYGFGLPDTLMDCLYWEVTWAVAGFLLGALWRRLPGRRGPMRSLPVAAAFALPVGLDAIGNLISREPQTHLALYAVAMLTVLTVTGIVLDLETFRGERHYWQSRLGLLLSIYHMRYFSLQVAYLLAQLIALFTLWQFFTDAGGPPEQGANPPVSGSGA
ncbi:DUF6185 family protein [Streptomyces sp. NPDC001848]|uniref:DUF6185 family protein n=1 Tax=Streptomyces sp. NPDC001848 TaxID=3364618 RepID=UPI0036C17769